MFWLEHRNWGQPRHTSHAEQQLDGDVNPLVRVVQSFAGLFRSDVVNFFQYSFDKHSSGLGRTLSGGAGGS